MLTADLLADGWRDERVKSALDLCLACKGCKSECPVNVDMANYKAEFLSHYYQGRIRPRSAYAIGLIFWWARLASYAPGLANFVTGAPLLRGLVKAAAGIAPERQLPRFARESFKHWVVRRTPPAGQRGPRVLLWADTFNNYMHPNTAIAAVEVLEAAGCQVAVIPRSLCCGRPLYDYGMVRLARRMLRQAIHALRPYLDAGVPVIGLEPSCVAVFRDELLSLFPNDPDARRLSQSFFLLSEFLDRIDYQPPQLHGRAVVHGHCHHKSVLKMTAELKVLKKLGLDFEVLDSGCCGMAGGFGFEKEHYEVSMKVGERVLLPAVRETGNALVIADGFSCREQIRQGANREALHLADVLRMALG
jgi:Fe-S oxidoreductase